MRFPYDGAKVRQLREEALYSRELLVRMARTTMTTVIKADSHGPRPRRPSAVASDKIGE